MKQRLSLEQFEALQKLLAQLQQTPAYGGADGQTVAFYDDRDAEIGFYDLASQRGWIQLKAGGSQSVTL